MSNHAVLLQPAFILHSRKYRETSLILDVLTEDFGKLSLIAKGVRKNKSKWAGLLSSFTALKLSYSGKAELKTLTHAEAVPPLLELNQLGLYCGFYVNELIGLFLHKHDPHPEVFNSYRHCLQRLAADKTPETPLRLFELELLESIGYGLQLEHDAISGQPIDPLKLYQYQLERGPVEADSGQFKGSTLKALYNKKLEGKQTQMEAKRLMRQQINFHLQGRELKSRSLMAQLNKKKQQGI